jgi:hypothetical protein
LNIFFWVYCPINWYKSPHTFMSYTTPKHHTCYLPGLPISSFTVWSPLFTFFSPYMHLTTCTFISLTQFEYHQKKLPSKNFQPCRVALTCTMPFVWNDSHLKPINFWSAITKGVMLKINIGAGDHESAMTELTGILYG